MAGRGSCEGIGLLAGSDDPEADQRAFSRTQVLFWLLGATDGHAENFSIALRLGGFHMTPLYDVLSAQIAVDDGQIRQIRMRLAMAVGEPIGSMRPRHFLQATNAAGYGVTLAEEGMEEIASQFGSALEKTLAGLPDGFPQPLAKAIANGLRSRANAIHAT